MVASITSFQPADETNATTMTSRRLEDLLRFGGLMLSAGETAFRVRRSMGTIARGLGFESLSVQLGSRNLVASGCRNGETATLVRDVEIPSVNTERIGALEALEAFTSCIFGNDRFRVRHTTRLDRKCVASLFDYSDIYGCRRGVWRVCFS